MIDSYSLEEYEEIIKDTIYKHDLYSLAAPFMRDLKFGNLFFWRPFLGGFYYPGTLSLTNVKIYRQNQDHLESIEKVNKNCKIIRKNSHSIFGYCEYEVLDLYTITSYDSKKYNYHAFILKEEL